jgi:hypothetical protein
LKNGSNLRDAKWTESIAVGDKQFVAEIKSKLGAKAMGRRAVETGGDYELREDQNPYNDDLARKNGSLRLKNEHFWRIS